MRYRSALCILALCSTLLLVASCRRPRAPQPADAPPAPSEADVHDAPRRHDEAVLPASEPMSLTQAGRERVAETRAQPVDPRDSAFAATLMQAPPRYPSDASVGYLGTAGLSAQARAAREAAVAALRTIRDGEVPAEPSAPRGVGTMEAIAELSGRSGDLRVAIPVDLGGSEWSIRFRLLLDGEGFAGELVMAQSDGRWYIADIQVTREDLPRRVDPGR